MINVTGEAAKEVVKGLSGSPVLLALLCLNVLVVGTAVWYSEQHEPPQRRDVHAAAEILLAGRHPMITTLLYIILLVIVLGVILWGVNQLLPLVPMDPRFRTVINVLITILVVIVIVYIIAGLLGAVPPLSLR